MTEKLKTVKLWIEKADQDIENAIQIANDFRQYVIKRFDFDIKNEK